MIRTLTILAVTTAMLLAGGLGLNNGMALTFDEDHGHLVVESPCSVTPMNMRTERTTTRTTTGPTQTTRGFTISSLPRPTHTSLHTRSKLRRTA